MKSNEWIKGLPLPIEYIGIVDLFFIVLLIILVIM